MLKIGCFKQNYCISVYLNVFSRNFLLNSGENQVTVTIHTYSQWVAVNFIISKISIPGKCSKCLK